METEEKVSKWTGGQLQYINFLAAYQIDTEGSRWTKEDFAIKVLHVDPKTIYQWQKLDGFWEKVAELSPSKIINRFYPQMIMAQVTKSIKQKDTQAFMALARQGGLLKADKTDNKNDNTDNVTIKFENA